MPRSPSGTYTLPQPAFVPNSTISSAATNSNNNDIANALTDSLSRTGEGGMSVALSLSNDGFFYGTDPDTGVSRTGANTQVITVGGQSYTFSQNDLTTPSGASLLPLIGEIRMFALSVVPTGWIFMRGQICNSTYPLWRAALITAGSPYGVSGSDPLFPNMQCVIPIGFDANGRGLVNGCNIMGGLLGNQVAQLGTANLPPYTPSGTVPISDPGHPHAQATGANSGFTISSGFGASAVQAVNNGVANTNPNTTGITASFNGTAQGGTSAAFSIVQPSIVINFIGRAA